MKLNVIRQRNNWWFLSSTMILSSVISILISYQQIQAPLHPGLEFVGGIRLQFERDCSKLGNCDKPIDINVVREVAREQGLSNSSIQLILDEGTSQENGILIRRTKNLDATQTTKLQNALSEKVGAFDLERTQIDSLSPTVGQEFFTSGLTALIVSWIGIFVYLTSRFKFDYAVFAIIALFHDLLITVGIFSILGLVLKTEVDSLFILALLTITGFSVNDTVVIYDRIRETINVNPNRLISDIVDDAVNQTLPRSINKTSTMLLILFAILIFGGETLKNFTLALIIGFVAGIYSSIFVASPLLVLYRNSIDQAIPSGPMAKDFQAFKK
jgi:preprotein translocase subunit SecF